LSKTALTREIEKALHYWHPTNYGGFRVDSFRDGIEAIEVPGACGSVKAGIVILFECRSVSYKKKNRNGSSCLLQSGPQKSANSTRRLFSSYSQTERLLFFVPISQTVGISFEGANR